MIAGMADSQVSRTGRHRASLPVELPGGFSPARDDVIARLLGQPRSMGARESLRDELGVDDPRDDVLVKVATMTEETPIHD
mgnify:CR=1 FL=1